MAHVAGGSRVLAHNTVDWITERLKQFLGGELFTIVTIDEQSFPWARPHIDTSVYLTRNGVTTTSDGGYVTVTFQNTSPVCHAFTSRAETQAQADPGTASFSFYDGILKIREQAPAGNWWSYYIKAEYPQALQDLRDEHASWAP